MVALFVLLPFVTKFRCCKPLWNFLFFSLPARPTSLVLIGSGKKGETNPLEVPNPKVGYRVLAPPLESLSGTATRASGLHKADTVSTAVFKARMGVSFTVCFLPNYSWSSFLTPASNQTF